MGLQVGTFEVGRAFDLQVVDTKRPDSYFACFGVFNTPTDRLACILHLSSHDNVRKVYVQGAWSGARMPSWDFFDCHRKSTRGRSGLYRSIPFGLKACLVL
ncbi:hypothetical protein [Paratractidigestivibacter faecalis]|uniref:hypothetical protein n=1 Tax=Paratractidigestivibacter faecalis TaxID=2292441 RepID=UPI003D73D22C